MRGRPREPIDLIIAKGKKHLTKQEIETRKNSEINMEEFKNVKPPEYLNKKQKEEFIEISDKLLKIGIMSELDEDCLARYLIAKDNYLQFTILLNSAIKNKESKKYKDDSSMQKLFSLDIESYLSHQDKAFKQCNACADRLGLTISSRCKLEVPYKEEQPKSNKFSKFKGVVS